jgi:hypothetical protein
MDSTAQLISSIYRSSHIVLVLNRQYPTIPTTISPSMGLDQARHVRVMMNFIASTSSGIFRSSNKYIVFPRQEDGLDQGECVIMGFSALPFSMPSKEALMKTCPRKQPMLPSNGTLSTGTVTHWVSSCLQYPRHQRQDERCDFRYECLMYTSIRGSLRMFPYEQALIGSPSWLCQRCQGRGISAVLHLRTRRERSVALLPLSESCGM